MSTKQHRPPSSGLHAHASPASQNTRLAGYGNQAMMEFIRQNLEIFSALESVAGERVVLEGVGFTTQMLVEAEMPGLDTGDRATEQEIDGTLFVTNPEDLEPCERDARDIHPSDVDQGGVGDCYFLATLAAIARVNPQFIRDMIVDHGDGTYTVTFHKQRGLMGLFQDQSDMKIMVDRKFWVDPQGTPLYAKFGDTGPDGPELWVMIIEKAWAKLHGGYSEIHGNNFYSRTDLAAMVTGGRTATLDPRPFTDDAMMAILEEHFVVGGQPVTLSTALHNPSETNPENVIFNHRYSLDQIDLGAKTLDLYNPWGHSHLDGIPISVIRDKFDQINFLNLSEDK